ncbi:hypothetical protein [Aeromicrobium sp. UC242_57]|uniref:hypothetical protein n=1 Tax=Aeromicrobium sp. UC242_57 TaxID=3374624 RepID=UPI003793FB01
MESAWDSLLDLLERLATDSALAIDAQTELRFATLATQAVADGTIDRELHVPDIARWLCGLAVAHRAVRASHPESDPDGDLGPLRVIATRWLHPARPR